MLESILVLWFAQVFLTVFPAWFLYLLSHQAKRSGYRERAALPFAAALFTWTAAGVINTVSAWLGDIPYSANTNSLTSPELHKMLDVVRVLLSTINTLFLTIGVTRLDNFPKSFGGDFLRAMSNRRWVIVGLVVLVPEVLVAQWGGGLKDSRTIDAWFGLLAALPITAGLFATFLRYEMGKVLTAGIIIALWLLALLLFYLRYLKIDTEADVLFLTSVLVTSKVAFIIVLVMVTGAWGRYYTSGTIEELKRGGVPERVRLLFELIPGRNNDHIRRNAYQTIVSYWPNSPTLMQAIKIKGPSSKEVIAAARNPQMIADLIEVGILNLSLSHVGDSIADDLMHASERAAEDLDGRKRSYTG